MNNFNGRQEILDQLQNFFEQPNKVVLTGIGGIGKTQIAAKFCDDNHDKYDRTCWLDGSNVSKSQAEMLEAFDHNLLEDPSTTMLSEMIVKMLCNDKEKVLLVVDGVTEGEMMKVNVLKQISEGRLSLLVTSQLTLVWNKNGFKVIPIPCCDDDESVKFLQQQLPQSTPEQDIIDLASRMISCPLALQAAISYIKKFDIPVSTYNVEFDRCRKTILDMKTDPEYDKTLLTVWDMAFNKIKNESESNYKNALVVLGMMAYMDNRFINKKTFLHWSAIPGQIDLNEITVLLCQYSLVKQSTKNKNYLEIHNLLQKVIQIHIQESRFWESSQKPKEMLFRILTSICSSVDHDSDDDVGHCDHENLWYVHYIKLMDNWEDNDHVNADLPSKIDVKLLGDIASRRNDV